MFCIFKGLALISPVLVDVRLLSCLVFKTMLIIYLLRAAADAERRDVLTLLKPLAPLRSPARLYLEMLG